MVKTQVVRRYMPGYRSASAVVIAAVLALGAAPAAGQDDLVPRIDKGRLTFTKVCGGCHGIDKPAKKNMDRPAWDELISSMEAKGAKITGEERELILDYLGVRNVFLTKCTGCHATERILDRSQAFSGWEKTVGRMKAMGNDLMTDGEARSIIAYLSVVRGETPAAK
jgi:mono/diheme cytochrome c family protein